MATRLLHRLPARLAPSLATLTAPCYLHQARQAAVVALLAMALVPVLAGLAFVAARGFAGKADFAEIAFGAFLLLFLIILLRPSTWVAPVTFAADRRGVHFVGGPHGLFVPWQEIGPMWLETAYTGDHPELSVVIAIRADSTFWDADKSSSLKRRSPLAQQPAGYLPLPLGTQGIDPQVTRESLETLRELSGVDTAYPPFDPGPGRRRWELVVAGSALLVVSLYFLFVMLRAFLQGQGIGVGFVIPIAMALAALWVVRYGWVRRC